MVLIFEIRNTYYGRMVFLDVLRRAFAWEKKNLDLGKRVGFDHWSGFGGVCKLMTWIL